MGVLKVQFPFNLTWINLTEFVHNNNKLIRCIVLVRFIVYLLDIRVAKPR